MSRCFQTAGDLERYAQYTDAEMDEFERIHREQGKKAAAEAMMRATLRYAFPEASDIIVTAIPTARKLQ
jgi:hypothetical protein